MFVPKLFRSRLQKPIKHEGHEGTQRKHFSLVKTFVYLCTLCFTPFKSFCSRVIQALRRRRQRGISTKTAPATRFRQAQPGGSGHRFRLRSVYPEFIEGLRSGAILYLLTRLFAACHSEGAFPSDRRISVFIQTIVCRLSETLRADALRVTKCHNFYTIQYSP